MSEPLAEDLTALDAANARSATMGFEQTRTLSLVYRNLRTNALISMLTVVLTALLLNDILQGDRGRTLVVWGGAGVLIELARLATVREYLARGSRRPFRYWWRLHHTMAAISGLFYAYLPASFFMQADPQSQMVITVAIISAIVTASAFNFASPLAFSFFAYVASMPLVVDLAFQGDPTSIGIAGLIVATVIGASYACDEIAGLLRRNLALSQAFHTKLVDDASVGTLSKQDFFAQVEAASCASLTTGDDVALLLIDLDNFDELNTYRGRADGDRTLQYVASTIRSSVRRADITGRLGADEFAVLLTPSSSRGASIVAENILRSITNLQIARGPDSEMLSASIGVAVTLRGQVNEEDLVATAAHACDLAKKNGRNQYETLVADGRIQSQRQFRLLAV